MSNNASYSLSDILMASSDIIAQLKGNLPAGCTSKNDDGSYNANSIDDVLRIDISVYALDGCISNGLRVKYIGAKNGIANNRPYCVHKFELSGVMNTVVSVINKSKDYWINFRDPKVWSIKEYAVTYSSVGATSRTEKYKVPMIKFAHESDAVCPDKGHTIENKVKLSLNRLGAEYTAECELGIFNMDLLLFEK